MLGGMGEEEVYKVTLMEEKSPEELAAASEKKTTAEKAADVVEEEEDQGPHNGDLLCHLLYNAHMILCLRGSILKYHKEVAGVCDDPCHSWLIHAILA